MSKLKIIALYIFRAFIAITTPIWILPYVIFSWCDHVELDKAIEIVRKGGVE